MNLLTENTSKAIIWSGLIVILIGSIVFSANEAFFLKDSILKADKVGQFGDFIGGIAGALWALAGVILFYVALGKQKEALTIQVEEFELQRNELAQTRNVLEGQSQTQLLMQFETSFYNLIELFQKVISEFHMQSTSSHLVKEGYIVGDYPNQTYYPAEYQYLESLRKGKECIKKIYDTIIDEIERNRTKSDYSIGNALNDHYNKYELYLRPYFNILTQILLKIDSCSFADKRIYAEILISTFTKEEIDLITIFRDEEYIDRRLDKFLQTYIP